MDAATATHPAMHTRRLPGPGSTYTLRQLSIDTAEAALAPSNGEVIAVYHEFFGEEPVNAKVVVAYSENFDSEASLRRVMQQEAESRNMLRLTKMNLGNC